jgi:hypothetical protein
MAGPAPVLQDGEQQHSHSNDGLVECDHISCALVFAALWTRPPVRYGFSLSDCWAWLRYFPAIAVNSELRLREEWTSLDPHYKTVLSGDLVSVSLPGFYIRLWDLQRMPTRSGWRILSSLSPRERSCGVVRWGVWERGSRNCRCNPRRDPWTKHFSWNGTEVIAQTPTGRCTIPALQLNRAGARAIRLEELLRGRHPPPVND